MLPVAVRTGLEPATPGVTGRYSNQLNYRTICSDLCVFVKRGCKGKHFFVTCKSFCKKISKMMKKVTAGYRNNPPSVVFRIRKTVKLNVFDRAEAI